MKHYQFALFFVLFVLAFAVSAMDYDDDDYYFPNAPYPGMGMGGWVDEYGRWHSGATTQTIVTSVLAVPAALAVGLMAL
ncbi:hypothetical protein Unana1_02594 [Umbelopsis nana]